jgi:hypothetical protein
VTAHGGAIAPYAPNPDSVPIMLTEPEEPYVLTDAGWPRPRESGLPVPWVAPTRNLGEVNEGRRTAGAGGGICQVCGEGFAVGDVAYMWTMLPQGWHGPVRPGDALPSLAEAGTDRYQAFDGAVLHEKCMRLTAAMCPHIRDNTEIILVSVPANDADPLFDQDGILRPTYPAEVCFIESPRRP